MQLQSRRERLRVGIARRRDASLFAIRYQPGGKPMLKRGRPLCRSHPDHDGVSTVHLWIDGSVIETLSIVKKQ
jgi:hypothetical protein